jgi:hypothetical protein
MWTIIQTELAKLKRKKMVLGIFILATPIADCCICIRTSLLYFQKQQLYG